MILISAVIFVMTILALADIISGGPDKFKNLDKLTWVFIVIIIPVIGSILWLVVGREWGSAPAQFSSFGDPRRAEAVGFTQPLSTEAELAALEREIERAEKQDRIRRLEAQVEEKRRAQS